MVFSLLEAFYLFLLEENSSSQYFLFNIEQQFALLGKDRFVCLLLSKISNQALFPEEK